MIKRGKGYRFGVEWIALNDDHDPETVEDVAAMISVAFLADMFGKEPEAVARDVLALRARAEQQGDRQ